MAVRGQNRPGRVLLPGTRVSAWLLPKVDAGGWKAAAETGRGSALHHSEGGIRALKGPALPEHTNPGGDAMPPTPEDFILIVERCE